MSSRIVLQIAVGGHDEAPAGLREAGGKRRGLPEVPAEPDDAQPGIPALQRGQLLERVVGAPVVYGEDLVGAAEPPSAAGELPVELRHVGRLVPHRDDDGDLRGHSVGDKHLIIMGFGATRQRAAGDFRRRRPDPGRAADEHDRGEPIGDSPGVLLQERDRRLAVPEREEGLSEVPDAPSDRDGDQELERRHAARRRPRTRKS